MVSLIAVVYETGFQGYFPFIWYFHDTLFILYAYYIIYNKLTTKRKLSCYIYDSGLYDYTNLLPIPELTMYNDDS